MHLRPYWRTFSMALLCSFAATTARADLVGGYSQGSGSQLLSANGGGGDLLFVDSAALGGENDISIASGSAPYFSVLLPGTGLWSVGDTVSITGLALTIRQPTVTGTFTFDIREAAGGTGASGTAGLDSLGTATASYTSGSTAVNYVNFDTPISFVADANSTTIGVNVKNTGNLALKAWNNNGVSGDRLEQYNYGNGNYVGRYWNISIAGTVAAVPEASAVAFFALISSGLGLATLRGSRRSSQSRIRG